MTLRTTRGGMASFVALAASPVMGSDFPVYWTGTPSESFHSPGGDVDGDGMADVVLVSETLPQQAFVRSGLNGSVLRTWTPSLPGFVAFPLSASKPAGDLNLDGFGDVALSILNITPGSVSQVLEIRSGMDGSVMATISPPAVSNALSIGFSIAGAGDLDGDGWPELLVSGDHDLPICLSGGTGVYNFEAPTFALQYYQTSWQCAQEFGSRLGRLDDVDGDGLDEFFVGAWRTDAGAIIDAGWIGIYSGPTGALLSSLYGTAPSERLGGGVAALGDVTGDGLPDVAVVRGATVVSVLALPTFATVYEFSAASIGVAQVLGVDSLGDSDGDGVGDFVVHWRTAPGPSEGISAFSGTSGVLIGQVAQNLPSGALYPWGGLGDVNGDGLGDFATSPWQLFGSPPPIAAQGLWSTWSWPLTDGAVRVYVSPSLRVAGTPAVGGTLQLQVVVPKHPGRPFQVVFAQDYASPAIPLGPFLFPIAFDSLFWASLAAGIGGTLDATGQGSVTVPVPNIAALHGAWFNASGVVYDLGGPLGIGCVLTHAGFQIP